MIASLTVTGWVAALAAAAAGRLLLARRMELVARACHELRGPLTAARLALQLAAGRPGVPHVPLEAVDLELGRAGRALDDLSAARRGTRPAARSQTFEVGALLAEVAEAQRGRAWARGARVRLEAPRSRAHVCGDRVRLARACENLLENAIEHGGGDVRLRMRAGVHTVRIEVLDDGPGLPAPVAVLARRPRGGRGDHGRGLAIVAETAARFGGRLAAAPTPRGARLVLELPTALRSA
ncbi:MAG TPA: HAMP domain-containing sensor histidine kinase [Conexibacter sp.]|nr:HAMP domain-containing sensor histidine kinase [Conexibacter sp.]